MAREAIQSVMTGSKTTAVFGSNGKLSGSGGCNQYSAAYTTTASNGITITQPASTMMACAEPSDATGNPVPLLIANCSKV